MNFDPVEAYYFRRVKAAFFRCRAMLQASLPMSPIFPLADDGWVRRTIRNRDQLIALEEYGLR